MAAALRRAWGYAWAVPATAVGLVCAALACCLGAHARIVDGALEVCGGALGRALQARPRSRSFCAITFGHVILAVDQAQLAASRAHEHVHVRQYERWGVLFFPLYLGESLLQLLRGRDPYIDNRFEREAFGLVRRDRATKVLRR